MKLPSLANTFRCTAIALSATVAAGCASQEPEPVPPPPAVEVAPVAPTPSLQEILQKQLGKASRDLNDNKLSEAHNDYQKALEQAQPGTREYHEACAGLIVVLSKGGDNPVRDLNRALTILDTLNASMAQTSRTLDSAERVAFISLRQMLEGEFRNENQQKQLGEEQRKQRDLIRENQQLQEALFKLRRLSLE